MRLRKRHGWRPGTAPGSLHPPAERRVETVTLSILHYNEKELEEAEVATADEAHAFVARGDGVTWVNVVGLHDVDLLARFGELFGLHPLALEDVLNTEQRPKAESFDDHLFVVTRLFQLRGGLVSEQLSTFVGERYVLTFQETPGDVFDPVRDRLRHARGRIRSRGADYLAYALLDAVVDQFFPLIEEYGERVEVLERELFSDPEREHVERIQRVKKELLEIRRTTWPMREIILGLERGDAPQIGRDIRPFLRDLYDHTVQIMDVVETYRDLSSGLMDLYLSSISHRMNEVMQVLTVMATIFIPLTFIAGLYGMNFDPEVSRWNMPELEWRYGYPASLLLMAAVAVAMLAYFRRKKWL